MCALRAWSMVSVGQSSRWARFHNSSRTWKRTTFKKLWGGELHAFCACDSLHLLVTPAQLMRPAQCVTLLFTSSTCTCTLDIKTVLLVSRYRYIITLHYTHIVLLTACVASTYKHLHLLTLTAMTPSLSSSARCLMNSSSSSRCFLVAPTQLR